MQFRSILLISLLVANIAISPKVSSEDIFDERYFQSYVADRRASTIGDTITLLIYEVSSAESAADTEKDGSIEVGGGFTRSVNEAGVLGGASGRSERGIIDLNYRSARGMETERAGVLKAQLSVQILDVDEVGKFLVGGRQKIVVNGEEQFIRVTGWLRSSDIDQYNTAISTRLSDAEIEYVGVSTDERDKGFIRKSWDALKKVW